MGCLSLFDVWAELAMHTYVLASSFSSPFFFFFLPCVGFSLTFMSSCTLLHAYI
jgi:hypothetical protein